MRSYEGLLRERIHVGLTAFRFRRERGLFEQERIARIRWSADGGQVIQWLGARRAVPIIGADTRGPPGDEVEGRVRGAANEVREALRSDLPDDLLSGADLPSFTFDPSDDRLAFGEGWALHPLADSALAHYRYASGDTLRVRLPDREVVLVELRVEPRRADVHLVAGSLWFDAKTGSLVRATYRPARAFDLELDAAEDADDVPGILKPVTAEISYITVEYSLHEFRYWLPRRFALEGVARLGRVVSIPVTLSWTVGGYHVNEKPSGVLGGGPLPAGWSRAEVRVEEDGKEPRYVTVIVPRPDSLLEAPQLSEAFAERTPLAFSDTEIGELKGELEALLPTYQRFRPRVSLAPGVRMMRYNRIEGLSVGVAGWLPLTPRLRLEASGRLGFGDWEPDAELALARGGPERGWRVTAYHRLAPMNEQDHPLGFGSSLAALALGDDHGQYYRATGASLQYHRSAGAIRGEVSVFHERQRAVELGTDFFVLDPVRDAVPDPVIPATAGDVSGARGSVSFFRGLDPNGLIVTGAVQGEAGAGDFSYRRLSATLGATHPLGSRLSGAIEVSGGTSWGSLPVQRSFFLGGSRSLRGFSAATFHGASYWRARGEVASGFAGARLSLFSDWGWTGSRADLGFANPAGAVGAGVSLLDGLVRLDLARGIRRGSSWHLHLYLDGLF